MSKSQPSVSRLCGKPSAASASTRSADAADLQGGNNCKSFRTQDTGRTDEAVVREILSKADLVKLGITASNPTLLLWESQGRFPKRLMLGPTKRGYLRSEVMAWITAKAAERSRK